MEKLSRWPNSVSWFALVGAAAALVHYVTAVSLEGTHVFSPSYANIAGFLLAFPVSYLGHRNLSFNTSTQAHRQSLPRFFMIALCGFCANQALTLAGLHLTPLPFWFVLGSVMVIVAVSTYILSRYWAFKS